MIGRPLRMEKISPDEARRELLAIMPAFVMMNMLLDAWAAAIGQAALGNGCRDNKGTGTDVSRLGHRLCGGVPRVIAGSACEAGVSSRRLPRNADSSGQYDFGTGGQLQRIFRLGEKCQSFVTRQVLKLA